MGFFEGVHGWGCVEIYSKSVLRMDGRMGRKDIERGGLFLRSGVDAARYKGKMVQCWS